MYRVIDLIRHQVNKMMKYNHQGNSYATELKEFLDLVTVFPCPLSSKTILTPTSSLSSITSPDGNTTVSTIDTMIQNEIQKRMDYPLASLLPTIVDDTKRASLSTSERLLWSLLKLCLQRGCILYSDQAASDVQSPESRVIQLLVDNKDRVRGSSPFTTDERISPDMSASRLLYDRFTDDLINRGAVGGGGGGGGGSSVTKDGLYVDMEGLLLLGQRDEALRLAVASKEWALAMLLGSVSSADKYQEVVRAYANSHFPAGAPMTLLSLMYSNQAMQSLMNIPDYPTTTTITGATTVHHVGNDQLKMWRHNLAAVLSNKGTDWRGVLKVLGYKLQTAEEVRNYRHHYHHYHHHQ